MKRLAIIGLIIIAVAFLTIKSLGGSKKAENTPVLSSTSTRVSSEPEENQSSETKAISADSIEVVHFHGTHQCWSCITIGEYALKTIKEKFPEEFATGKIVFKEINGELPENREAVVKYQARGSSLFVNAVRGEKDDIAEDVTVWRLVANESQFINYFENKLNGLLGK